MKKVKIEFLAGKSVDELYAEFWELYEVFKHNTEEQCQEEYKGKMARLSKLAEVLSFHESQEKAMTREAARAEVIKNKDTILAAYDDRCFICQMEYKEILQVHHIIPLNKGGTNELDNLVVLCPNCHAIVHHHARSRDATREEHEDLEKKIGNCFTHNAMNRFISLAYRRLSLVEKMVGRGRS